MQYNAAKPHVCALQGLEGKGGDHSVLLRCWIMVSHCLEIRNPDARDEPVGDVCEQHPVLCNFGRICCRHAGKNPLRHLRAVKTRRIVEGCKKKKKCAGRSSIFYLSEPEFKHNRVDLENGLRRGPRIENNMDSSPGYIPVFIHDWESFPS